MPEVLSETNTCEEVNMEFSAKVTGLAAKDTSDGNKVELKLTAQFDSALFAQLGDCFTDRVFVTVNHPQQSFDFEEDEEEAQERAL